MSAKVLQLIVLASACALTACAPRAVVPPHTKVEVPASKPVAPAVSAVAPSLGDAVAHNASLKRENDRLAKSASEASAAARKAKEDLERLRKAGNPTRDDLDRLWEQVSAVESRNMFLEVEVTESGLTITAQAERLKEASMALEAAQLVAAARDEECTRLRDAKNSADKAVAAMADEAGRLRKEALDWKGKYERAAPYRNWCIALGVIAVLLAVASVVLRRIFPYIPRIGP